MIIEIDTNQIFSLLQGAGDLFVHLSKGIYAKSMEYGPIDLKGMADKGVDVIFRMIDLAKNG